MLALAWPCADCTEEVTEPGTRCAACTERVRDRAMEAWARERAMRVELGDIVVEAQWYENEGDDRAESIAARADDECATGMTPREYDEWCEGYWRAWGLARRWSGLPPELPVERWVETWFFDQPAEHFDPESDVEVYGYPARRVADVDPGPYL